MNTLVKLNAGMGMNLGPNFAITANVGVATPATLTKAELIAGATVAVDNTATQVIVTSTGVCTSSITLDISDAVL